MKKLRRDVDLPVKGLNGIVLRWRPIQFLSTDNLYPMEDPDKNDVAGLKNGSQQAISELWDKYANQLQKLARKRLGALPRTIADSEDIALGAFASLCRGVSAGRFPDLEDEQDLWRILIALTRQKAVDLMRSELSQKKGGGKNVPISVLTNSDSHKSRSRNELPFVSQEIGPDELILIDDECRQLMSLLPDDECRKIARLKLEQLTSIEIASELDVAPRTVERRLQAIRKTWQARIWNESQ